VEQADSGTLRVTVDRDKCIASGECVLAAPQTFDQDDEGLVVLRQDPVPASFAAQVHAAVRACPAAVIAAE
jgi:ferredoxin